MSQATVDDDGYADAIRRVARDAGFDDTIGDLAVQVFDHAVDDGAIEEGIERDDAGKFAGDDRRYPPASLAGAVYAAARVRDIPTKPGEVADTVDADEDDVGGYYRRVLKAIPFTVEPENPTDWVRRLCDDLDVAPGFEADAIDLAADAVDAGLHVGKSTSGFAAAVVYATSAFHDAGIDQEGVADTASVSPTTVRNQYRDVLALWEGTAEPGDPDAIREAINDLCDRIEGLPGDVRVDAHELAKPAVDSDAAWVERTDPAGVAAGVVYVAAKDARVDVSQVEVAETAGVSKSTVVNRVNDVRDWRKRARFDGVNYNDLKRLANDHDVDVGPTPEREYLVDRLADAGVDP